MWPRVIGSGAANTFYVSGAVASPMTAVAFVPSGADCNNDGLRSGVMRLTSTTMGVSPTFPIEDGGSVNQVWDTCYTVTYGDAGENWVKQSPSGVVDVTVVVAVADAVASVAPSVVAVGRAEPVVFSGLEGSVNVRVGFGIGGCAGTVVGVTNVVTTGAATMLGSALPTAGLYRVCVSVDNGGRYVAQTSTVTMEAVRASSGLISAISPNVVGTGSMPAFVVSGTFKQTSFSRIGFSLSSDCSGTVAGQLDVSLGTSTPYTWASGLVVSEAQTFTVCFTADGTNWVAQSEPVLNVAVARANSITSFLPAVLGAGAGGANVVADVVGPLGSATAFIGFDSVGSGCTAPVAVSAYNVSGELDLGSSGGLSAGTYALCYTVESPSTGFVEQTSAGSVRVVEAQAADVAEVLPSYMVTSVAEAAIGVRLGVAKDDVPVATAMIGFDPTANGCSVAGVLEGVTALQSLTEAPASIAAYQGGWLFGTRAGSTVTTTGNGTVCYSVDSGETYVATELRVALGDVAPAYGLGAVVQPGVQTGVASRVILRGLAATSGPTTKVAFVASGSACSDGGARVSEVAMTGHVLSTVEPLLPADGRYSVCVKEAGGGSSWTKQDVPVDAIDCTTKTSCGECRATPLCGWCVGKSQCVLNSVLPDTCAVSSAVCTPFLGTSCALENCPRVTGISPAIAVSDGGTQIRVSTELAANVADLECRFVYDGTIVESFSAASVESSTSVLCRAAESQLGILGASVSLTQSVGSAKRVAYGASGGASLSYYECGAVSGCGNCYDAAARPECGFCLLEGGCMSRQACLDALGYNASSSVGLSVDAVWVHPTSEWPDCPVVSSVAPAVGPTTGGVELTLTGTLFVDANGRLTGAGTRSSGDVGLEYQYQCVTNDVDKATNGSVVSSTEMVCELPESVSDGDAALRVMLNGAEIAVASTSFGYVPPPAPIPPPPSKTTQTVLLSLGAFLFVAIVAVAIIAGLLLKRKRDMEKLTRPPEMSPSEIQSVVFGSVLPLGMDGKSLLPLLSRFVHEIVFDYEMIALLAEVTPSTEVDRVAKAAIIVYEHAGLALDLLLYQVSREVTTTLTLQTLFRTNSMATKMFKLYSKLKGFEYVRSTLGRPINKLMLEDDVDVDGLRAGKGGGAQFQLLKLTQTLFNAVRGSIPAVPTEFRYLFRAVQGAIQERFPVRADELAPLMAEALREGLEETSTLYAHGAEAFVQIAGVSDQVTNNTAELAQVIAPMAENLAEYEESVEELATRLQQMSELVEKLSGATDPESPAARRLLLDLQASHNSVGVGGFFFLRFLVPAITAPEAYGLVHDPPDVGQRKLLVLLGKAIQNLSNQKEFGGKEKHMVQMNSFITSNAETIAKLLDDLAHVPINAPGRDELEASVVPTKHLEGALVFLYKHAVSMRGKMLAKLQEIQIGSVELSAEAVVQRERAAELLGVVLDEIEAAKSSGASGSRLDYNRLRGLPFITSMGKVGDSLAGNPQG
ncbi:uncharacterized protein AMSG_07816 [Thecamonas trahens ATCC 50062]|uniref:Ras-GAP domain-containing protein n=1 Tax=Thecamonas trahens ATCC 50062 TaxID=461836 RepID=A0A0L0DHF9_THETB|nr:hypothetical protein AMSG_07816 [Thecamonas trahens ATCC 50062]KNC51747.1 hypothetical protein AMSG_07816 [Thecamonas trahens ATCC 50062]|eukprot:XP_013755875.1 hypothetical protein AMSG_07816 [Thecamonas trahens ATCC 50062]